MTQLYIKLSDAEGIVRAHLGSRTFTLDELEKLFNFAVKQTHPEADFEVTVLQDEHTTETTRALLIEDAVQQYLTKDRAGRRNIAAFTDTVYPSFPSYISVNREANGKVVWTAREAGHNGTKSVNVEMTETDLVGFAESLYFATRAPRL